MAGDGRPSPLQVLQLSREADLPDGVFRLLAFYRSYMNEDGWAWPGDELTAQQMGVSERTVRKRRKRLADYLGDRGGRLEHEDRGPKTDAYRIVLPSEDRKLTSGQGTEEAPEDRKPPSSQAENRAPEDRMPASGEAKTGTMTGTLTGRKTGNLTSPIRREGEEGEEGESTDTEGSSLQSSPSGAGAGGNHSREEPWNARLAPLLREVAYAGEGPPPGHDLSRCLSKARHLLGRGYDVDDLEDAIRGLRRMADTGHEDVCEWIGPGDRFTLLAFGRAEEKGQRLVQIAAHEWRKSDHPEWDDVQEDPSPVGDVHADPSTSVQAEAPPERSDPDPRAKTRPTLRERAGQAWDEILKAVGHESGAFVEDQLSASARTALEEIGGWERIRKLVDEPRESRLPQVRIQFVAAFAAAAGPEHDPEEVVL